MRWLQLGILAEIVDRSGIVRQTAGCSIVGRRQFFTRLQRLNSIMEQADQSVSWADLFAQNTEYAHHIEQSFRLNSLDLDWFTPEQVEGLLFRSLDTAGNVQPGLLVVINKPNVNSDKQNNNTAEPQSLAETISYLCDDLESALALASELPADLAYELNQARVEQSKSPNEKEADNKAHNLAALKKMDINAMLRE